MTARASSVLDAHGALTDEAVEQGRGWMFVPTRRVLGPTDPVFPELRRTAAGELALLAYTSLALLVEGCGRHQSWVLVPADWFEAIRAECRFDTIAINVAVPTQWQHDAADEDWPGKPEDWDEH